MLIMVYRIPSLILGLFSSAQKSANEGRQAKPRVVLCGAIWGRDDGLRKMYGAQNIVVNGTLLPPPPRCVLPALSAFRSD